MIKWLIIIQIELKLGIVGVPGEMGTIIRFCGNSLTLPNFSLTTDLPRKGDWVGHGARVDALLCAPA